MLINFSSLLTKHICSLYNKLRQQYSTQAQEYHRRGMSAAAMYYTSEVNLFRRCPWPPPVAYFSLLFLIIQSRRYTELYKKCNQQAALQIIEEKNAHQDERTVDLHELHVVEALTCLESFIAENTRGMPPIAINSSKFPWHGPCLMTKTRSCIAFPLVSKCWMKS